MTRRALAFAAACAAALAGAASATAQTQGPVVELYTSQGCSSCPPADAFLAELARRDDVVALSFHVGYWDYIGWKDTFASPANAERQRSYAELLGGRRVYTPQMVIDGVAHVVGSDREAVLAELAAANARPRLPVKLKREDGHIVVRLPKGPADGDATIWLMRYDPPQRVEIDRGENDGRAITYHNVVREFSSLGVWRGEPVEITLSERQLALGGRAGCAVIVQKGMHGPVLGAAKFDFASTN